MPKYATFIFGLSILATMALANSAYSESVALPTAVEEMAKLPTGAPLPTSFYENFSVNEIAVALVQRMRSREIDFHGPVLTIPIEGLDVGDSKPPGASLNLMADTDLILFFGNQNLRSIIDRGFLNQHQTGTTSPAGALNKELRKTAEDNIAGFRLGDSAAARALRPKSAIASIKGSEQGAKEMAPDQLWFAGYGDIAAVFDDSVKARTLWVTGDSLYAGANFRPTVSAQDFLSYCGTFYRKAVPVLDYEVVIFGDLTMSMVRYFLVADESLVEKIKYAGKPVYRAVLTENGVGKGRLLYSPASKENVNALATLRLSN